AMGVRLFVVAGAAAFRHPHVAQEDVHAIDVQLHAGPAHRGQDAAPVRVAAVERGLYQGRVGDDAGDAVRVRRVPRALDADLGHAGRALAVAHDHLRDAAGGLREGGAEGVVALPLFPED